MDGFFGIGIGELIMIAIVALIVLGPERLPGAFREVAKFVRQVRNLSKEFTDQFGDEFKALEDLDPRRMLKDAIDSIDEEEEAKEKAEKTDKSKSTAKKPAVKSSTTSKATTKPTTTKPAATKPATTKPATTKTATTKPAAADAQKTETETETETEIAETAGTENAETNPEQTAAATEAVTATATDDTSKTANEIASKDEGASATESSNADTEATVKVVSQEDGEATSSQSEHTEHSTAVTETAPPAAGTAEKANAETVAEQQIVPPHLLESTQTPAAQEPVGTAPDRDKSDRGEPDAHVVQSNGRPQETSTANATHAEQAKAVEKDVVADEPSDEADSPTTAEHKNGTVTSTQRQAAVEEDEPVAAEQPSVEEKQA